jgi:hypothetical protein
LNSFFSSSQQEIELLRSSDGTWTVYPELRFACTGLSKLDACGVKRHEVSLHFYITILARAQYKAGIDNANDIKPEKLFSGSLNIRISLEIHGKIAMSAERSGISIDAFIRRAIEREFSYV